MELRDQLVDLALKWQARYGVAPSITSSLSEFDASRLIGMHEAEYSAYMKDKTAVSRGHDFTYRGVNYQIKAHRPSGKPGSKITNAEKAKNYKWDVLIWIRYNEKYVIQEAWAWDRAHYIEKFEQKKRVAPEDMRYGKQLV